jgi:hypothetical protein
MASTSARRRVEADIAPIENAARKLVLKGEMTGAELVAAIHQSRTI